MQAYLQGLLSEAERTNSGQVADGGGEATPDGFPYWLSRADWDAEAVRDARRRDVSQHLGEPHGVLGLDETGCLNKGAPAAGVARQYSGTAGNVEHGQSGVVLSDARPLGQALWARERYLPNGWTEAGERCRQAGLPPDRAFAPTPPLARQLLTRAFRAGVPAPGGTGARVYGDDRRLRRWLQDRLQSYVLAVAGKAYVWLGAPQRQVKTILAPLPLAGWPRLSAGDGTQGPRGYDDGWLPLAAPLAPGWRRGWLVRRSLSTPTELTASVVLAPHVTPLQEVIRVAGSRWTVESGVEQAKGEVGLDQSAGRSWTGGYRPITLAMGALALLTVMRAGTSARAAFPTSLPPPQGVSPWAAFKARRGLSSPGACPSGGDCGGGSCWPYPTRPATSWPGHGGGRTISAPPSMTSINVVRHALGAWLHNYLVTTVVISRCKSITHSTVVLWGGYVQSYGNHAALLDK